MGSDWGTVDRSKYMTRSDAGRELRIPHERVNPMIDRGELKGMQRGKVWYVDRESVAACKKKRGL